MTDGARQDPYDQEIIRNALVAVGDEMFDAMARTSMSPIIYEALDYSVGVTDGSGDLIAQGNGTTVFLGMIDSLVRDILAKFGERGDIRPGDVFISNDPYEGGGTHLSDIAFAKPVFWEGELVAFTVNKAHWVDVGGMSPGSFTTDATEIFQEGLQIPTVKLIDEGREQEAVFEIFDPTSGCPRTRWATCGRPPRPAPWVKRAFTVCSNATGVTPCWRRWLDCSTTARR